MAIAFGSMEVTDDIDKRRLDRAVVTQDLLESVQGRTEVQRETRVSSFQSFAAYKSRKRRVDF